MDNQLLTHVLLIAVLAVCIWSEAMRSKRFKLTMKTLTDLQADVADETTVEQSAITLLGGLSAQIAALKTTNTDPTTAAEIDTLANTVEANKKALADAVTANTPAA